MHALMGGHLQPIFIGVDGGATKSVICIEDNDGHRLGLAISGPANIAISVEHSWQSIYSGIQQILSQQAISLTDKQYRFYVGMGLAGCELRDAYDKFIRQNHPFAALEVTSDSHIACIGAHNGKDGAIIIAGTGVVGYQIEKNKTTKVGGWGFPHDDEGGGAWLGVHALRVTLQWLDGRTASSELAKDIYGFFNQDIDRMVSWAHKANSRLFATLAPFVIRHSEQNDAVALELLQKAAKEIDRIGAALKAAQIDQHSILPCSLVGGVTPYLPPYLGQTLRARLRPCELPPVMGALMLIRQSYLSAQE